MTNPEQPFGGREYSPLENPPPPVDPYAPVDYPASYPNLPPPVYPQPYAGVPNYPGYPGYPPDPYDPYRRLKQPGTNGKAIAALMVSLVGLLACGIPSVVGAILGIIAMQETKRTGQDGYGLALAGVIIGALSALFGIFLVLMMIIGATTATYSTY
jgi:Domain of unknown function (DUF4190)